MEIKLQTICQELWENKYPRDDTLIEKLITTLENDNSFVEKFAENACVILSRHINDLAVIQADSLAAFIRIIGAITVANFDKLNRKNILIKFLKKCIQTSTLQGEKSITHATLFCLKGVCSDESRICLLYDEVYTKYIKSCLDDSSLFVAQAAMEVFCKMILWEYTTSNRSNIEETNQYSKQSPKQVELLHEVVYEKNNKIGVFLDYFVTFLEKIQNKDITFTQLFIDVLVYFNDHIRKTNYNMENFLKYIIAEHNVPELLLDVIPEMKDKQRNDSLDIIKGLNQKGLLPTMFKKNMIRFTLTLLESEQKHLAVQVSTWTLQWFREDGEDLQMEMEGKILTLSSELLLETAMVDHHQLRLLLRSIRNLTYLKSKRTEVVKGLCSCLAENEQMCPDSTFQNFGSNQSKKYQASLDVLGAVISDSHSKYTENELTSCMKAVCHVLSNTGAKYQVVSKAFKCLLEILKRLQQVTCEPVDEMLTDSFNRLKQCLPEKLMNMKWEIRDSAVEFVGSLAPLGQDFPFLLNWLKKESIADHMWHDVNDGESYVRASAVYALTKWLLESGTKEIILDIASFEDIFEQMTAIVKHDTEAFPRRAAMEFYNKIYAEGTYSLNIEALLKIMCTSISDLDWEVKISILNFCDLFITKQINHTTNDDIPEYIKQLQVPAKRKSDDIHDKHTVFENLKSCGIAEVLFSAINDWDKSVKEKSCTLLKQLQTVYSSNNCVSMKRKSTCEIEDRTVKCTYDLMTTISLTDFVQRFPSVLEDINLEEFTENIARSTDYDNNLDCLLDDIQVAMGLSIGNIADQDDENNAAAIDCY